ncbi:hypothetical protein, partial [Paraburkholderia ultramafica]|uniref:hypothetical protein n=1 Tax=Paraburkholderia ultramafica TaxID=1544867 RepID=UPI001C2E30C5
CGELHCHRRTRKGMSAAPAMTGTSANRHTASAVLFNYIYPTSSMRYGFSMKFAPRINTDKSGFNHASV